jgi:hypothetical protein
MPIESVAAPRLTKKITRLEDIAPLRQLRAHSPRARLKCKFEVTDQSVYCAVIPNGNDARAAVLEMGLTNELRIKRPGEYGDIERPMFRPLFNKRSRTRYHTLAQEAYDLNWRAHISYFTVGRFSRKGIGEIWFRKYIFPVLRSLGIGFISIEGSCVDHKDVMTFYRNLGFAQWEITNMVQDADDTQTCISVIPVPAK